MCIRKIASGGEKGKPSCGTCDHCIALDWSLKSMAIGQMGRRDDQPDVFERPSVTVMDSSWGLSC